MRDIQKLADEYGVVNLRFFIPMKRIQSLACFGIPLGMTSSSDPDVRTECQIDERRYKVGDGYKIELRAVQADDPNNYYGSSSFYQMDLESLIRRNPEDYQVYVLVDDPAQYVHLNL